MRLAVTIAVCLGNFSYQFGSELYAVLLFFNLCNKKLFSY